MLLSNVIRLLGMILAVGFVMVVFRLLIGIDKPEVRSPVESDLRLLHAAWSEVCEETGEEPEEIGELASSLGAIELNYPLETYQLYRGGGSGAILGVNDRFRAARFGKSIDREGTIGP